MKTEADYSRERKCIDAYAIHVIDLYHATRRRRGGGEGEEGGWGYGGGCFDVALTAMGVYLAMSNACTKFWGHHTALHRAGSHQESDTLVNRAQNYTACHESATCSNKYHLKKPKRNPSVDVLSCSSNSFMIVWFGRENHPCHAHLRSVERQHARSTNWKQAA